MVMKDIPDHTFQSTEILKEFIKKSLLKWAEQKSVTYLQSKHSKFV